MRNRSAIVFLLTTLMLGLSGCAAGPARDRHGDFLLNMASVTATNRTALVASSPSETTSARPAPVKSA
jgi:hypothetical protein